MNEKLKSWLRGKSEAHLLLAARQKREIFRLQNERT